MTSIKNLVHPTRLMGDLLDLRGFINARSLQVFNISLAEKIVLQGRKAGECIRSGVLVLGNMGYAEVLEC